MRAALRRIRAAGFLALTALVAVLLVFLAWAHAVAQGERPAAIAAFDDERIRIETVAEGFLMTPATAAAEVGVIMIPGARVDPYAYMDKLRDVVAGGAPVLIIRPAINLAIADQRDLDALIGGVDAAERWVVAGHSLGGTRACLVAAGAERDGDDRLAGLLLLGSYCANDLSSTALPALSISAENDGLSTREDIAARADALPAGARLVEIPGANHASFGDYGVQAGDGPVTASDDEVRTVLTGEIARLLRGL
ncbi:alpha/beta hydrolase [Microcella daejeonensis]|uniref:alpha/beta hydrolase n=1 Tax=Microcella daejeonensis TaxID=2994971 RepID=UPI00226EE96E|nr:alpha/beta hydrolase [Microcella daejeonensis]WAB82947.1 alpha/beta hydrolase [Microcella daejeonensis]